MNETTIALAVTVPASLTKLLSPDHPIFKSGYVVGGYYGRRRPTKKGRLRTLEAPSNEIAFTTRDSDQDEARGRAVLALGYASNPHSRAWMALISSPGMEPLHVARRGCEVRVAELPLNQIERHPIANQF